MTNILIGTHHKCLSCKNIYNFGLGETGGSYSTYGGMLEVDYTWKCPKCGHENGPISMSIWYNPEHSITKEEFERAVEVVKGAMGE